MNENRKKDEYSIILTIKFLIIILFILNFVSLMIVYNSPATGYEVSIYDSTPIIFWFSLFISLFVGFGINFSYLFSTNNRLNYVLFYSRFLIFLNITQFLALPIIRSYYLWDVDGDVGTHIGYVNYILANGSVSKDLFYPIMHIITIQMHLITNINLVLLFGIIPLIFNILYFPFIYLLIKTTLYKKREILFAMLASSILVCGVNLYFAPISLSYSYFPLWVYIIVKYFLHRNSVVWRVLTVMFVILNTLFHPVQAMVSIISILSLPLGNQMLIENKKKMQGIPGNILENKLLILSIVLLISWISSFSIFNISIESLVNTITGFETNKLTIMAQDIYTAKTLGYNVTEQIIKVMGGYIAYILATIISFPFIINKFRKDRRFIPIRSYYAFMFVIGTYMLFLVFLNLDFGPLRFIQHVGIISIVYIGYMLNNIFEKAKKTDTQIIIRLKYFFVMIMFLLIMSNQVLLYYPSTYIKGPNYQTTKSEVQSLDWFFEHRNTSIEMAAFLNYYRYADLLLTPEQKELQKVPRFGRIIPLHFGYDNNISLPMYYKDDLYLVILEKDILKYSDIFPEIAKYRWTVDEFKKLDHEKSISKTYFNGMATIYYIDSIYN